MALICITSGVLISKKQETGNLLALAGHGMVIYSVLNAAGDYQIDP